MSLRLQITAFPAAILCGALAFPAAAKPSEVSRNVRFDVSRPIRDITEFSVKKEEKKPKPMKLIPLPKGIETDGVDPAEQGAPRIPIQAGSGLNFPGVGEGEGFVYNVNYAPSDTTGAPGINHYVQWVNSDFAVFSKSTGAIVAGFPKPGDVLWQGFGGGCEANNDGDPIVQYDRLANRWVLSQFAVSSTPYLQCVAVSTTSDPTGSYYRYAFSYGTSDFNDYPKMGVWPDGYYVTYNIFRNAQFFSGSKLCALDRTKMLAGDPAAGQICFQLSNSYGGVLPSDLDSSALPPAGTPNLMVNYGSSALRLWKFRVNWATPSSSTLTGPVSIPVASFTAACGTGGTCIPQPGTANKLDSLGDRLMFRAAYRKFATYESMVLSHSVQVGNKKTAVTSVRWYELRNPVNSTMSAGTPVVAQQGTLSTSDGVHRWMSSIAQDKAGNIAVGYSASNSSIAPSIRYTGRLATDGLNAMQAENIATPGGGSQTGGLTRWGDYSHMSLDPVDECSFWYTTGYLRTTGSFNWSTRIHRFKLGSCQ